jgi:hypothetical protein
VDSRGRTIFVADAHREGDRRFVVRADEKLTAFLELDLLREKSLPMKGTGSRLWRFSEMSA